MYRYVTELKALVIDIDSFEKMDYSAWDDIAGNYACLFLTLNEKLGECLAQRYGKTAVFTLTKYLKQFAPTPVMHGAVLKILNVKTTKLAYVSCNINFLKRALTYCSGTIWITKQITYEDISTSPDIICMDFPYFMNHLKSGNGGFFCEKCLANSENKMGSIVPVRFPIGEKAVTIFVLGRYYGYTHYMIQKHPYSAAIYWNKKMGSKSFGCFDETFSRMYQSAVKLIGKQVHIDGVCAVPPHRGDKSRFHQMVSSISERFQIENLEENFICIKDYPKQRGRSSYGRQENIVGAFQYNGNLDGKTVILLDDVVTTGSTLGECVKTLYQAGAANVIPVVLAVNQFPGNYWSSEAPQVICPHCNDFMHLLVNSKNRSFFYSCYRCKNSLDFIAGWQQLCNTINNENYP